MKHLTVTIGLFVAGCAEMAPREQPTEPRRKVFRREALPPGTASVRALSLSRNGLRLAVIDESKQVFVYGHTNAGWALEVTVTSTARSGAQARFGHEGNVLAVSCAHAVDGGAPMPCVDVHRRGMSGEWALEQRLVAGAEEPADAFGAALAVSGDEKVIVVGAPAEASNATTVNGDRTNNGAPNAGAAYAFVRGAERWAERAYLKAANGEARDAFGTAVDVNSDGTVLAISAPGEASRDQATPGDNRAPGSGAVYVFQGADSKWTQQAYLKAGLGFLVPAAFGTSIALSPSGTLVFGIRQGSSSVGSVDLFGDSATGWRRLNSPSEYAVRPSTLSPGILGSSLVVSDDGKQLLTTSPTWGHHSSGVVNIAKDVGAGWLRDNQFQDTSLIANNAFGHSAAMSGSGKVVVATATANAAAPVQVFSCDFDACEDNPLLEDDPPTGSGGGGGGGSPSLLAAGSCTDSNGVCVGSATFDPTQLQAFRSQCMSAGNQFASQVCSPCSGPICRGAKLHAMGVEYRGDVCYGVGFCSRFAVDTAGSCLDTDGVPEGTQCR